MAKLTISAQKGRNTLKEFQQLINPYVASFFKSHLKEIKQEMNSEVGLKGLDVFRDYATRDCKRLRASFIYYTYKMYGGKDLKTALKLGVVIELVHAYLLVLDDFMDISDYRRRGMTAHNIFTKEFKDKNYIRGDSNHYGNSIAVNVALVGCHMAMHYLYTLDISAELKIRLSLNLNKNFEITGYGQMSDVTNAFRPNVQENDVLDMLKWKTGVYTYENPIHSGAILAGVPISELEKLSKFAIPGGISFQIQDDILGMFGDAEVIGKSAMDDIREGKYTLLIHKALEQGTKAQCGVINKYLGKRDLKSYEHEKVKKIIKDTGSLTYSMEKAQKLVKQAKAFLSKNSNPKWEKEGLDYLNNIADYVIERDK